MAPNLDLVKGWGGALVRERIVAAASRRQVILVGHDKLVRVLGEHGRIPVEVIPFARGPVVRRLESLGLRPTLRTEAGGADPQITDNGNVLLDCAPRDVIPDGPAARALEAALLAIPGVVDTGLFLGTAERVLVGYPDGRVDVLGGAVMGEPRHAVVFLLDVDNTLLDNDRVAADLRRYLEREVGAERQERYWAIFESLRAELGYADYLGALQRYRVEYPRDPHLLAVSSFLVNYPFANRLYPESLDVLEHLAAWGPTVILSDGDVVFQPRKIERSGLFDAVEPASSSTSTRSASSTTSSGAIPQGTTCWSTTSSAS